MVKGRSTVVWNRACDVVAGTVAEAGVADGDLKLAHAITLDGAVQSGGLVSAVEQDLVTAGVEAFRWFGLDGIADIVERAAARLDPDGSSDADELVELEDDPAYYAHDVEGQLSTALARQLDAAPGAFAPLG